MYIEEKYSYTKNGVEHEYHVVADESGTVNPRTDWDNAGTMVCFHDRYDLGDEGHGYNSKNFGGWEELEEEIHKNEKTLVILPIYMIDHSGLSVSIDSFNDPWDSGKIGFIFISKEKAKQEWPNLKGKLLFNQAFNCLKAEVETYDHFLRGNVHGYIDYVKTTCDHGCVHLEQEDSCWGFLGDIKDCGVLDALPEGAVEI